MESHTSMESVATFSASIAYATTVLDSGPVYLVKDKPTKYT